MLYKNTKCNLKVAQLRNSLYICSLFTKELLTMKKILFLAVLLMAAAGMNAQNFSPERTGGVYFAYPGGGEQWTMDNGQWTMDGLQPFYISHYGRHGSRWLPSSERYEWVMTQFQDKSRLTPLGKSVRQRLKKICRNASGNAGQLTPLGAEQHRGIARRMAVFLSGWSGLAFS